MSTPRSVCDDFSTIPIHPLSVQPEAASTTSPGRSSETSHAARQSSFLLRSPCFICCPLMKLLKPLPMTLKRRASSRLIHSPLIAFFRLRERTVTVVPFSSCVGPDLLLTISGSYGFPCGHSFILG